MKHPKRGGAPVADRRATVGGHERVKKRQVGAGQGGEGAEEGHLLEGANTGGERGRGKGRARGGRRQSRGQRQTSGAAGAEGQIGQGRQRKRKCDEEEEQQLALAMAATAFEAGMVMTDAGASGDKGSSATPAGVYGGGGSGVAKEAAAAVCDHYMIPTQSWVPARAKGPHLLFTNALLCGTLVYTLRCLAPRLLEELCMVVGWCMPGRCLPCSLCLARRSGTAAAPQLRHQQQLISIRSCVLSRCRAVEAAAVRGSRAISCLRSGRHAAESCGDGGCGARGGLLLG